MLQVFDDDLEAEELGKSSVARRVVQDAIKTAKYLEEIGSLTPWELVLET